MLLPHHLTPSIQVYQCQAHERKYHRQTMDAEIVNRSLTAKRTSK